MGVHGLIPLKRPLAGRDHLVRYAVDKWTPVIIVALPLIIGLMDVALLHWGSNKATISYTMLKISTHHPLVPLSITYSFAVLMGHLFFPEMRANDQPAYETVARMFVVLSPTVYSMVIIAYGNRIEGLHREALSGDRWVFAFYMIVAAVLGGIAGRYGLPQHVPPDDPNPPVMRA